MQPTNNPWDIGGILLNAFLIFLPVAGIAVAFGFVYWLFAKRRSDREKAVRDAYLAERRALREAEKKEPSGR